MSVGAKEMNVTNKALDSGCDNSGKRLYENPTSGIFAIALWGSEMGEVQRVQLHNQIQNERNTDNLQ